MSDYIEIPQAFAELMQGKPNSTGESVFNYATTLDNRCVCDPGEMDIFPDDFDSLKLTGWSPIVLQLNSESFPSNASLDPPTS